MRTLTPTQEDYIRAVFYLGNGAEIQPVALSRYLKLTKQTVTERLQDISKTGLLNYKRYGHVSLTSKGKKIAQQLTYRHRLIEVFLYKTLKQPKDKIHNEAHLLEHAFSDSSIKALKKLLGSPKQDPHGKPI